MIHSRSLRTPISAVFTCLSIACPLHSSSQGWISYYMCVCLYFDGIGWKRREGKWVCHQVLDLRKVTEQDPGEQLLDICRITFGSTFPSRRVVLIVTSSYLVIIQLLAFLAWSCRIAPPNLPVSVGFWEPPLFIWPSTLEVQVPWPLQLSGYGKR